MNLRNPIALSITIAFILLFVFSGGAQATTYVQYRIQLNADGSATWIITQVSGINGTADTWTGFQQKINALVSSASSQTHREMSIDDGSLQMSTTSTSTDSKTTEYGFTWLNFSVTGNGKLVVGDVFGVSSFFAQLYGDGALQINYPTNCTLQSATPAPDQKDPSTQTLEWLGTQFFVAEEPNIVFTTQARGYASSVQPPPFLLLASVSAVVAVAATIAAWIFFMRTRSKVNPTTATPTLTLPETEEEKVLRLLRSSGGNAYQSAITEQFRFSKAKTSMLLTGLERKGLVRRYKGKR